MMRDLSAVLSAPLEDEQLNSKDWVRKRGISGFKIQLFAVDRRCGRDGKLNHQLLVSALNLLACTQPKRFIAAFDESQYT